MAILVNVSNHGLEYVAMAICDIVNNESEVSEGEGLLIRKTWLTPETCYWLYQFLKESGFPISCMGKALDILKNHTNHPEMLK